MKILMLGWEFPPYISGGLGTACYGLTKALDALGHEIVFVLPKPVGAAMSSHLRLVSPDVQTGGPTTVAQASGGESVTREFARAEFVGIPAQAPRAYQRQAAPGSVERVTIETEVETSEGGAGHAVTSAGYSATVAPAAGMDYDGDMVAAAHRYARMAVGKCGHLEFDAIHAHDWLTYPAGIALSQLTGKPLVIHVHSTEFDRSGEHVNQPVYDIERMGMHSADAIICVSYLTKSICERRYSAPTERLNVVYNGVEVDESAADFASGVAADDKIVLFLGRITMQKGPEYFVAAAKRVLEKCRNVKFVVAGSGDLAQRMIELAASMGIGHKVLFTGFLRGADVKRVFSMADCYVMPSVSEPFGIAPLEAMSHDVPVIISRQSGVSEVLTHALKVDFWDIDEMANKIIAVLRYPPLSRTLREHGALEIRRLTWDGAARKCEQVYRSVANPHLTMS